MALFGPPHPEFTDFLVHFSGRAGNYSDLEDDVAAMSAAGRLESILRSQTIWTGHPFKTASPVVCFSEATRKGLNHLIGVVGYQPWGIVFHRDLVYNWGGSPVFHYRPDEWEGHREALPAHLRPRFVRFEAGKSEWLWEREWRIVFEDGAPGFQFAPDQVEAIIVGNREWSLKEIGTLEDGWGDTQEFLATPDWAPTCERWCWNPDLGRLEVLAEAP
jgi:hypothetical protein